MNMMLLSLVELFGKSVAILLAAFLLCALPRLSAAQRSLIWLGSFLVLLLLPLTLLVPPLWGMSVSSSPVPISEVVPMRVAGEGALGNRQPVPEGRSLGDFVRDHGQAALVLIWAGGVAVLLSRNLLGLVSLQELVRESWVETSPRVNKIAAEARVSVGTRRVADLRSAASCLVPLTWGVGRCTILLPKGAGAWPQQRLEAALRHEYAHIARLDWFSRWLANLAAILFWPNPLVWSGLKALIASQEQSCDDLVITSGVSSVGYADDLLACARLLSAGRNESALSMARQSTLRQRIDSLLDENRSVARTGLPARSGMIFATVVLLALSAAAQVVAPSAPAAKTNALERAKNIRIPQVSFQDTPLDQVATVLQKESQKSDPTGKGLEFHYATKVQGKTITWSAKGQTLYDILGRVKELAGLKEVAFTHNAVVLVDSSMPDPEGASAPAPVPEVVQVGNRLENIMLEKVELSHSSLDAVAVYLEAAAKKADPEKIGVRIVCEPGWEKRAKRVTLSLNEMPLGQVILYVAKLSGSDLTISPEGVAFGPGAVSP